MKKFFIIVIVLLAAAAGAIYFYRYDIFQYSAESLIQKNLPPYMEVGKIFFDLENGKLEVSSLAIKNPPEYSNKYLAEIGLITCKYGMKGKTILDGIEIKYIEARDAVINIERLANGDININNMEEVMKSAEKEAPVAAEPGQALEKESGDKGHKKIDITKLIKLPDGINIKTGKVVFSDRAIFKKPYVTTFEDINAEILLGLNSAYTVVTSIATSGRGALNDDKSQEIEWNINMDPRAKEITLSSRFEISHIDIMHFKPYYNRYSPVDIISAFVSGTLVFDFDHGNIGSLNTLRLRNLKFRESSDSGKAGFWEAPIGDIVKYLQSSSGEVYFDFKIKGNVRSPKFFPGPIVKDAMQRFAVDKISSLFSEGDGGGEAGQSDADKVMNVLKGFLNK